MRKIFRLSIWFLTGAFWSIPLKTAFAAEPICPPGFESLCRFRLDGGGATDLVGNILSLLLIIAIFLALIYLVYGGIRYIMSGGDKGKVDEARKHIIAAIVGLIIAFAAFAIVNVITFIATGTGIGGLTIPTLIN